MKIKTNLLAILTLISISFIVSNCSNSEGTNISSIHIDSTISKSDEPIMNSKNKMEEDIVLSLDNYKFNLNKPFEKDLLKSLDTNDLAILRNSIYAKYGYIFSTKKYTNYFSQFSWYSPNSKVVEGQLNNIDKQNVKQITTLEEELEQLQFKSSKLGFLLVFPKSWKYKYRVEESDMGITVYFKPKKKVEDICGEFFSIINTESLDLNENFYDTIGDKKYFEAKNIKYFIGGPTDFAFPEEHPESNMFRKMKLEVEDVLKTLEPLK